MSARGRFVLALGLVLATVAGTGISCRSGPEKQAAAAGVVEGKVAVVRSITGGRLAEWTAVEGRAVAAGEPLGRIDPGRVDNEIEGLDLAERESRLAEERVRIQLPALQARVDYLRKQVERLERLKAEKAVAGGEVDKNRVELAAAEAAQAESSKVLASHAVERARIANKRRALDLARADLILKSPVDGIITAVLATAGEVLLPGAPAAEVLDPSSLYVEVRVEEGELGRLKIGSRATVRFDGREGESWPGSIFEIGSQAEFSRSFTISEKERKALLVKVKVRVEGKGAPLKLGMPATVLFDR